MIRRLLPAALFALAALPVAAASVPPEPSAELLARAQAILERAPLIDAHNDLPSMLIEKGDPAWKAIDLGAVQPQLCADIPRLRAGRVGAQYWSIFTASENAHTRTSLHEAVREIDVVLEMIRRHPELELARTADDIERIHRAGRIASLMGIEGGHMIEDALGVLRIFYRLGARYMTLTHWNNVPWADAATDRPEQDGLSERGEQIVREMNRLGMFVDISHVSPATMLDVLRVSRAPVIFSHSNARAVAGHVRNVPDEVLRLMPANGGVVHVNFLSVFVAKGDAAWQEARTARLEELRAALDEPPAIDAGIASWESSHPQPRGTIAEVADHIDHIRAVAGIDHIGIGGDYYDDGVQSMVPELADVSRYPYLFAELLRRGYSDEDLGKIAGRNHLRAMRRMEAVAER